MDGGGRDELANIVVCVGAAAAASEAAEVGLSIVFMSCRNTGGLTGAASLRSMMLSTATSLADFFFLFFLVAFLALGRLLAEDVEAVVEAAEAAFGGHLGKSWSTRPSCWATSLSGERIRCGVDILVKKKGGGGGGKTCGGRSRWWWRRLRGSRPQRHQDIDLEEQQQKMKRWSRTSTQIGFVSQD